MQHAHCSSHATEKARFLHPVLRPWQWIVHLEKQRTIPLSGGVLVHTCLPVILLHLVAL